MFTKHWVLHIVAAREPLATPSLPPANAPFGWSFPERGCAAIVKSHGSGASVLEVVAPQNFIEPSLAITLGPLPSPSTPLEVFKECGYWKTAAAASQLFLGNFGKVQEYSSIHCYPKITFPVQIDTKCPSCTVQGPQIPLKASQGTPIKSHVVHIDIEPWMKFSAG